MTLKRAYEDFDVVPTDKLNFTSIYYFAEYNDFFVSASDNYLNAYFKRLDFVTLFSKNYYTLTTSKVQVEKKLGEPYNSCDASRGIKYRQLNCIEECINQGIAEKHNCSIPSYYELKRLKRCFNELSGNKTANTGKSMEYSKVDWDWLSEYPFTVENLAMEFHDTCEKKCPKECESSSYSPLKIIQQNDLSNKIRMVFKLSDFSSLEITQLPKMSVYDMVANIGGNLSLFIGISFVSVVEVFEFFIELLCAVFFSRAL